MIELTSREMVSQRNVAVEHRALDAPRVASPHRRSPVIFVILAAVLALTAVTVAERVEQRVIDAPAVMAPAVAPAKAASPDALAAVAPAVVDAPLTSAVLPSGAMALTLRNGAATITTGLDAPAIELSTASIGDLDLGDAADDAVIAQADGEVSYDWGDVTEWYRTVPEGIEHGYTIDSPVSDSDDLTVTVEVNDGTPTLVDADRVAISRPDATPVWYRGLVAFDADGTDLPATLAVVDGAIELRVDTNGARYPVTIDPIVSAVVTLSTDVADSRLGFAVDVSGNRMVASAPFAGPTGFAGAGKVFVYERVDGVWVQTAVIQPATPEIDGRFGDAVALSPDGTRIAVGESDRLGDLAEPGRVFVFERQAGGVWNLLAGPVVAPAPAAGDGFGASVAWVGGDRLVIGAPFAAGRGAVYDYAVAGALTAVSPAFAVSPGDEFGFSVAVDERPEGGHRLIVGSPGWTGVSVQGVVFPDLGAVTSYDDVDGLGFDALSNAILTSPLGPPVRLGGSVAVSGNRIAFGSSGGASITGTLYRTENGGAGWIGETTVSLPKDPDTPDLSNRFVALEGDTLALGVPGGGGSVNLFRANGLVWPGSPSETVRPSGVELGDSFGWATALDGALLVTGAPGDDGPANALPDSGAVYTTRLSVTATFINPAQFAAWDEPNNWNPSAVPGAGDTAIVPLGTYPELGEGVASTVDNLTISGQLRIRGDLRVETVTTVGEFATVDLQPTATFDPSGDLALDGELSNGGQVVVDGSASVTGIGRFINDGELRKTGSGTLTFGSGVVWTARFYSEVDVTGGNVEILGPLLDTNTQAIPGTVTAGTFRVAAGTSLEFVGDLIVGPGTRFVTEITGSPSSTANYGRIVVDNALGFDRTVPNPGPGLVGLEAILNGFDVAETDVFPIITCNDCAADPGGDANGIEFDDFALSGLTAVQTRNTIELRTIANKIIAPELSVGLGTDVSVDGDRAVVGSRSGGPLRVYQFVAGDWVLTQSLENGTAERVVIDGTTIFADGLRYTPQEPDGLFDADQVIGGTTFDVDGRLAVRGLGDGTAVISLLTSGEVELVPDPAVPSFGADVAIVDLGGSAGIAAVSAPAFPGGGRVYLYDLAVDEVAGTVSATPQGFVSGGTDFGRSIALSADDLVVGDPFGGTAAPGAGAAWVYGRTGAGATFTGDPVQLQASDAEVSDTLGDDVAIDGDVIVVGAPIAQKFNFPLRDGAAYVFQHNGTDWIETDILRAPDGFNGELFGDAVAVSGNRVLVGAPNDVNDNGPGAGAFYFYETTPPPSTVATFTNTDFLALWDVAANWSTGAVPGAGDAAVVPFGTSPVLSAATIASVGELTLGGSLYIDGRLELIGDSTVSPTGVLYVQNSGALGLDAVFNVESGGQVVVVEGPPGGLIEARDGASFAGAGLVANSGIVAFSGSGVTPIGPGLTWNSGLNSLVDITSGTVDIQTAAFGTQGTISIAPGAVLRSQNPLTLADTSSLEFFVNGPASADANYGRLEVPNGTFTANGNVVTSPLNGYAPTGDAYPLITCAGGGCVGGTFDEVFGGRIDARTENEVRFVLVNTYVGPAPNVAPGNWASPFGWSFGVVPGATDAAVIPTGRFVRMAAPGPISVGSLTVEGDLSVSPLPVGNQNNPGVRVEILDDSVVTSTGRLVVGGSTDCTVDGVVTVVPGFPDDECVPSVTTLQLSADLRVDGDFSAATRILSYGVYQITSNPVVELDGGASLSGTGTVFLSADVVKNEPGTVTFGPDLDVNLSYGSGNDTRGVLEVTGGTLDIQSAPPNGSFTANGTIEVGPGATLSIADDLTLSASSVIDIGIDGPAAFPANYGRIVLPTGDLTAAGTLRTTVTAGGYVPTTDDVYPLVSCTTGTCDGGTFGTVDAGALTVESAGGAVTVRGAAAPVGVSLDFGLDLAPGAPSTLPVAPSGIAVNTLDRNAVARSGGGSANVAASSISSIGPEDTSLASIQLGATPLRAVILESDVLSAIPLVNIDIEGGWERIIALSPNLRKEPLASLTFGQVLAEGDPIDATTPAGALAATPLRAVDVDGTPLRAVSLAAIALGSTPLRAVPLRAVAPGEPNAWCEYLGDELLAEYANDCNAALDDLSLIEATLRGASIDAAPLRAVPLRAVDVADSPLRAVLVEDIALGASPIGSIPLRAVPLRAVDLQASPLRAVPLRAVPLRAVPVSAIDLDQPGPQSTPLRAVELNASPLRAVTTSITLDAAPLRAVDVNGTPVSAIQVQGAPLRAVPISAVMLADVPLRAVPLEEGGEIFDWCEVLAGIDAGFDCSTGVDLDTTTINDLSIRGVPLRAVPLRAVPLRAVLADGTIGAIPLRAVPLRAVPLRAVPLGGISLENTALGSIDVNGTPLRAVPLRAVDLAGTSLGAIPLRAVAPGAIPLRAVPLRAVPLRAVPLRAVPLRAVVLGSTTLAETPLRAVDVLGSPLRAVPLRAVNSALLDCGLVDCERGTLGDALLAGAISGEVTLEQIQPATEGIALAELVAALLGVTEAEILTAIELAGLTLDDLTSLDDLTLGDLPRGIVELDAVTLGALLNGLPVGTFADLVDAIIDPFTGKPVVGLEADILAAIADLNLALGDLERLGDVTLGDILAGTHPITLADIEPVLRFVTVDALQDALNVTVDLGNLTLGDLTPEELGQLTLADLSQLVNFDGEIDIADLLTALGVGDLLDGFTLGDLLLAFLDPSSLAFGGVEFADVDVNALPSGTVGSTTFAAEFTLTASSARTIELQIQTPRNASYVTGSGRITGDGTTTDVEPTRFGDVLTWSFVAQPGVPYSISFDVLPTLTLGSTSLSGVARVVGTDIAIPASASVAVVEGTEPNDFTTPIETTPAFEDVVYLTYITDADDIDVFEIEVAEDDELVVELSNLDADLDLVLWGERTDVGANGALSRTSDDAPLVAVTDPDGDTTDAEPLDDFSKLDEVDPSLGVIGVSNADGTKTETLSTGRLDAGTYYIQVYGANGATNVQPAALQLKVLEADQRPVCAPITIPTFTGTPATAPSLAGADTLLLINEERLEQLHGAAGRSTVRNAADRLVAAAALDPSLGITPVVVPVDAYPGVQAAYDAWDSAGGSCDPDAANAVVAAINNEIIDPVRDQLTHVVILGPDELIPMARLADETQIANEYDFRHEFDGDLTGTTPNGRNAFTSVFWESSILSDEPYGDAAARSLGDRYLYVTDLALGRVVETPAEIADALDTYVGFGGTLDIDTATVLGYDFLADGSAAIAGILDDTIPVVDDELALGPDPVTGDGWTAARATQKLREAATNALVSLNAHFDHYRALPAIGDKVVDFDENLIAQEVRSTLGADALAQSLVFSMGCHSGLSVSDITIGRTQTDWAQTFGQLGSLYVGNTGFGYGDTETVAYTEQLMALFASQLTTPFETGDGSTTVGQALAWAKNDYVAGLQTFSVYDEKAVQESTFYGLPFYRVGLPTEELPAAPTNVVAPDATGTPSLRAPIDPTNDEVTSNSGVYFSNTGTDGEELVIVAPGRPIQPKLVADVSVVDPANPASLATRARGAIVLGMDSTYRVVTDPVIATPIFDESGGQLEPESTSGVFPTKPLDITTTTGPAGERQAVVVATGQYRSDDAVQRLDDDIDLVVYYADDANGDFSPPTIGTVESSITGGVLTVSVATDTGDDVDRVYVLVAEDPGSSGAEVVWRGLDLAPTQGNRWTGSLALAPGTSGVEFIVQAKDTTGNVGYATNKARNFGELNAPPAPPPPPPPADELSVSVPPVPVSGWYTGSVILTIDQASTPATVSVNGVALSGTFESGDTVVLSESGVQNWRVVTESDRSVSGTVRIDADGSPRVILGVPSASGTPAYASGSRRVDVICRDTSLATCALDIDGVAVANGDPLPTQPGSYTLNYAATDALGNVTSGAESFTIVRVAAPSIRSVTAPFGEQLITSPVTVSATFSDASVPLDSFTAAINWGDGTPTETVASTAPTPSNSGSFSGTHVYAQPGVYEIVVSVTDAGGLVDTDGATVTVIAPAGAPVITDLDAPTTPQLLSSSIVIDAEFSDASAPFDSFTAVVDWGDGTTSPAAVTAPTSSTGTGSLVATKIYAETGVYPVTVTLTDANGESDSELYEFVVVYDPTTNGRVTGSGAYWSGAEASPATPRWGAPAFFGYDARYKNGASLPTGETQLRLLGQFLFKSTRYDYLIVNDAVAIAEGVGTTGGGAQYRFRVQGIDNGWLDFFQITIWNPTTGAVLYDNGVLYDDGDLVLLGGIKVKGG